MPAASGLFALRPRSSKVRTLRTLHAAAEQLFGAPVSVGGRPYRGARRIGSSAGVRRWCTELAVITWQRSSDEARVRDGEEAVVCAGEMSSWQQTVDLLRAALRVTVDR